MAGNAAPIIGCSFDGCYRPLHARGLCIMHYHRFWRHGDASVVLPRTRPRAPAPCVVDNCARVAEKRGWCSAHYKRWVRYGSPDGHPTRVAATDRFWSKVDKNGPIPAQGSAPGPCWQWTAALTPGGYGQFRPSLDVSYVAHRYSYERLVGPIPDGLQLDHLCRNRACVNPRHVEPVAQAENIRRGFSIATKNRLKTHCPQGHPYNSSNTYLDPTKNGRRCRQCARERNRLAYGRKRAS